MWRRAQVPGAQRWGVEPATSPTVSASCTPARVSAAAAAADQLLDPRQPIGDRVGVDDEHRGRRGGGAARRSQT